MERPSVKQIARMDTRIALRALPAQRYRCNLLPINQRMNKMTDFYKTADEIVASHDAWFRANSQGKREIYFRPDEISYVMIDDVKPHMMDVALMYRPALVVETSLNNHQVWYKVPRIEDAEDSTIVAKWITGKTNGDTGCTDPTHLSRLPGYMNRKEVPHRHKYRVRVMRTGYNIGQTARLPDGAFVARRPEPINRTRAGRGDEEVSSRPPMSPRTGDNSSRDWSFVLRRMEQTNGEISARALVRELTSYTNKSRANLEGYVQRTVERGMRHFSR